MICPRDVTQPQNYVPVCASVICEAPGVIYVSIDPEVWKIRCRQCQEKTEHRCALKKLKNRFRGNPSKRRQAKDQDKTRGDEDGDSVGGFGKGKGMGKGSSDLGKGLGGRDGKGSGGRDGKGSNENNAKGSGESVGRGQSGRGGRSNDSMNLDPSEQLPDDFCTCEDRPRDVTPRANVCLCEVYKPLNFMLDLEVSGEFKPAYVPKAKKGRGKRA